MQEQALHFNTENFSDIDRQKLTKKSNLKFEIKKLFTESIKLKLEWRYTLNKRRLFWDNLQTEWESCTRKKLNWYESKNRLSIVNDISYLNNRIKSINTELSRIKIEIKLKNKELSKL